MTPLLYVIAKLRLLRVAIEVADAATAPRPRPYAEVLDLDRRIGEARDALPPGLRWAAGGLSSASCLSVSPQVIMERIWLEVWMQRLRLDLHRKFLEPPTLQQQQHAYSQATCLAAAVRVLEFQHLVDEEIRPSGRLYQSRYRLSNAYIHDYLFATSILCFYLQTRGVATAASVTATVPQEQQPSPQPRCGEPGEDTKRISVDKIKQLLRKSQGIWERSTAASKGPRKAAAALRYVLGDSGAGFSAFSFPSHGFDSVTSDAMPPTHTEFFPGKFDPFTPILHTQTRILYLGVEILVTVG